MNLILIFEYFLFEDLLCELITTTLLQDDFESATEQFGYSFHTNMIIKFLLKHN